MSREAWGDPPDREPPRCPHCDGETYTDGCEVCAMARENVRLRAALHRVAWRGLSKDEIDEAVNELVEYGTEFVTPLYAVIEGIERKLKERNADVMGGSDAA